LPGNNEESPARKTGCFTEVCRRRAQSPGEDSPHGIAVSSGTVTALGCGTVSASFFIVEPDPKGYTDPDGEADVKPNLLLGIKAHKAFYNAVEDVLNPGEAGILLYDTGMGSILTEAAELLHQEPELDSLAHPLKRPDITVISLKGTDIYELKPASSEKGYKHVLAEKQLSGYINTLANKLFGGTKGGSDVPDNLKVPFPEAGKKAEITFTSDKEVKGLYYYKIDDGLDN
jgi:hypothetical protein